MSPVSMEQRIARGLRLALLSSVAWTFWTVLIDVVDSMDKQDYVLYLLIVETFVLLFSAPLVLYRRRTVGRGRRAGGKVGRYPLYAGACFGVGNIVFYGLVGGANYPFVASMMFSNVIVLSLLLGKITSQRLGVLYVLGTLLATAGLVAQAMALYGADIAVGMQIAAYSAVMAIAYAVGYYFAISYAYAGRDQVAALPSVYAPILAVALAYGLLSGNLASATMPTQLEVAICLLIAASVVVGYFSEQYAFLVLKGARVKYLNMANVFTNLEIVGAIAYTALVIGLSYQWLMVGLVLTAIGVIVIAWS